MPERERVGMHEPEPGEETSYDKTLRRQSQFIDRQMTGKLLIRPEDREWEATRQGRIKFYLYLDATPDGVLTDFKVFVQDIRRHSGKHVHQGGVIIYVLEGEGWSVIDGTRVDWKAGDILLLPIKKGGVEHQHFNRDPDKSCKWVAMLWYPYFCHIAGQIIQREEAPKA